MHVALFSLFYVMVVISTSRKCCLLLLLLFMFALGNKYNIRTGPTAQRVKSYPKYIFGNLVFGVWVRVTVTDGDPPDPRWSCELVSDHEDSESSSEDLCSRFSNYLATCGADFTTCHEMSEISKMMQCLW